MLHTYPSNQPKMLPVRWPKDLPRTSFCGHVTMYTLGQLHSSLQRASSELAPSR